MFVSCKMLGLQADRLADIMLEQPEESRESSMDLSGIMPSLSLKNIKFRYADGEPWVLDGISLHIPAGQSIALVGPSGGGKTTLCKIILGLLEPTQGEVLIGGIPIRQLGIHPYRRLLGTVMQEDVLLAGSILENIAFFDTRPDVDFAKQCGQHTGIHSEICAMPMGYQTLVGDMGSSLSGGQKQRILLARALYKKPRVVVLDEATSHLDLANERNVTAALSGMEMTRIMVAHRTQTINAADRVVALEGGSLIEVRSEPLTSQTMHLSVQA